MGRAMGQSLDRGHVLALSLWDDVEVNMLWLDSKYPLDKNATQPGVLRGDCQGGEYSTPTYLRNTYPNGAPQTLHLGPKNANGASVKHALLVKQPLGSANHGVPQTHKIGQRNVCGKNAAVVLIALVERGACVVPTKNCWFERDALCYAFLSLIRELLSKGFARVRTETHNS